MSNKTTAGFALKSDFLAEPPIHVPDGNGGSYKTELVTFRSHERTEKYMWWHDKDPRPEPHNHPWPFKSQILSGGYTEHRHWLDEDGKLQSDVITYRRGDINNVPRDVFHVVHDVQPETVTKLVCGEASENYEWGYLDLSSKEYAKAECDPHFIDYLRSINPHLRPRCEV